MIVVGGDASTSSLDALRWAHHQALLTGMSLHVVTCWDSFTTNEAGLPATMFEDSAKAQQHHCAKTLALLDANTRVDVSYSLRHGNTAHLLIAASESADLLVLGSRGHGGFVGMLLGSVTQHCVAHASCPVVVIRHQTPPHHPSGSATPTAVTTPDSSN